MIQRHHQLYAAILTVFLGIVLWFIVPAAIAITRLANESAGAAKELASTSLQATATLKALAGLPDKIDAQLTGIRMDVLAETSDSLTRIDKAISVANDTEMDANAQLRDMQGTVSDIAKLADHRLEAIEKDTNTQLAVVTQATAALEKRYTELPTEIRADREYQGLVAETMGVLGATKITMGQVAKASKTFDDKWPGLLDSIDLGVGSVAKIAANGQRVTDKAMLPCVGPHSTAVARALARTGCVLKDFGPPVAVAAVRSGVL